MNIPIPLDAINERLDHGRLWTRGWGNYNNPTAQTCFHGAVRVCDLQPGDAYLIEQVGARYGFGTGNNDEAPNYASFMAKVPAVITDDMLAETFGPQWEAVVALVRRVAVLTAGEVSQLDAAWAATRAATRAAALDATRADAWADAWAAAWAATRDATRALVVRDLIGQHGFTQAHYDTLTGPLATVIGKVHLDDPDRLATDGGDER